MTKACFFPMDTLSGEANFIQIYSSKGKKNPLIKFQAINKAEDLEMTLKLTERRVEIFQFYVNHTIELNIDIKSIEIQLKDISDLKEVV